MKNLQEILGHQAISQFETLQIRSDQPIVGLVGSEKKPLSGNLGTKDILQILKASLPGEVLAGIAVGKAITHSLSVGTFVFALSITLTPEKTLAIDIFKGQEATDQNATQIMPQAKTPEAKATSTNASATTPSPTAAVDRAHVEALLEGDALLYYSNSGALTEVEPSITQLGYKTGTSNNSSAVVEAVNYKEFPLFVVNLATPVKATDATVDPVLISLAKMPMERRRRQFSVLMAPNLETGNPDLAYSFSVQLVVNSKDSQQLATVVQKALAEWQRSVKVFHELLATNGKS